MDCTWSLSFRKLYVIWPHGSVVLGSFFRRLSAAGLNREGSMRLSANPPRSEICCPPLHAGEANVVKSPASMAGVGTHAMFAAGCWRTVVPW
jgi:hypothetical protein